MREVNALKTALRALPKSARASALRAAAPRFAGETGEEWDLWLANNLDALWGTTLAEARKVGGAVAETVEAAAASVGRTAAAVVTPVASSIGMVGYVAGAALLLWAWRSRK